MSLSAGLDSSLRYLASDEARESLAADPYWPKWDSPWWHMMLLHELGETKRIPAAAIRGLVDSLNRVPLKIFPIHAHEFPAGLDRQRHALCHCQLGNAYQLLATYGVNVDEELPWIRPWFLRYQMEDGGMNCDSEAYLVEGECPSSMVGLIAAFEAVLLFTPRAWTAEEENFLERGAKFLMDRKLTLGSPSKHNADEREQARAWPKLCFPRFYLYDVLRGLNALTLWAEKTNRAIPRDAIAAVVAYLEEQFPDGVVRKQRYSFEGVGTTIRNASGEWLRRQPATFFPLLREVSEVGSVSPILTKEWERVRARL
jgi:hypothetical protein